MEKIRLVQLKHPQYGRRVALVSEPRLTLLNERFNSVYALVLEASAKALNFGDLIQKEITDDSLDYEAIYLGQTPWQLLPPLDHPDNPHACLISGTGLTHQSSALNRQSMHIKEPEGLTDSMKIYRWGLEGGKPKTGQVGTQPEWFYKGCGTTLIGHGEPLQIPPYGDDGGEEAEVAGLYVIDHNGTPIRVGFCNGNEFSDHVMEKKNYLYLAPSKLRQCAIGPELVIGESFSTISGTVRVRRNGEEIWQHDIKSGEENMAHSLANLEHHHFKYDAHRIPGQVHIHFFGADAFSFGNQIRLEDGDSCEVNWKSFGRPLINPIQYSDQTETLTHVAPLVL